MTKKRNLVKVAAALALASVIGVGLVAAWVLGRVGRQHVFTFPAQVTTAPAILRDQAAPRSADPQDWPQWRGIHRDGRADASGLLKQWPDGGPRLVWTAKGLGAGWSSVSVAEGVIYTQGVHGGQVQLESFRAEDGEPIWSTPLGEGGDPNGTPTISGDRVFAVTREGRIVCVEAAGGQIVWSREFVADFGGHIPTWGYSESPLVDGEKVICTPGADEALLVALDRATGELIWKTPAADELVDQGHSGAGYSSAVISHAAGVEQYVQMLGCGAVGVSAADGTLLWAYSRVANSTAVIPTPVVRDDYVFVSSGYGAGAALVKIARTADGLQPNEVYFHRGNKVQNHHGGIVLVGDHIYLGNGHNQGMPLCLELVTGNILWGPVRGPGQGSAALVYADGMLYFRYEDGRMALVEATPNGYHLVSEFQLPSVLDKSWPHPAIAHGRLYLRDQDVLLCYDLTDPASTTTN
jgi:outer membrane protein assembly factor BamB